MAIIYSTEQQQVIDVRKSNVLVSAAAGSGKTAVLVERILRLLTQKEERVSLHQLLVVTFTKLAAQEMRERIGKGIEAAIEREDDPLVIRHLLKQLTLLPTAKITTLHSFCLELLKNHYPILKLDPKFKIGNETELVLMQEELLDEILEEEYELESPAFLEIIESFSPGKNDEPLKELILSIYRFSMSYPWPKKWLEESINAMALESVEDVVHSKYYQILLKDLEDAFERISLYMKEIKELMELEGGPTKYLETYNGYQNFIEEFQLCIREKRFTELSKVIKSKNIPALSRATKGFDKELAKEAKEYFDEIKKIVQNQCPKLVLPSSLIEEIKQISKHGKELTRLTFRFMDGFALAKERKGIVDFNDFEHFSLKLLYNEGEFSELAQNYKMQFYEVLVDEYQDTNEVQEAILRAVSKQLQPNNNLFMVGDLKQSIYRFRLAKPEIFSKKYDVYTYESSPNIKIDLSKNFRSRKTVIDFCNHICTRIMSRQVGDVTYDEHSRLYYGALGYKDSELFLPEIVLIDEKESDATKTVLQGTYIAHKIKELMEDENFLITEKDGSQRRMRLGDVCILMRSPSGVLSELKSVFDIEKISYHMDISSGYFDAIEVQILLNFLRILDNPYQDIPLVTILRSPLMGLDEKDLIEIRNFKAEGTFFESAKDLFDAIQEEHRLFEPLRYFFEIYAEFKNLSKRVSLSQLIRSIYSKTGYPYMVSFMENGQQRFINLEFLEIHARKFETSSYKGLFNFIRYIEHIQKYEIEIPEPIVSQQREDQVRFMSIHKSKGLEFPVVFIMDCQRQFNRMDFRKSFLLHQELGFGIDYIQPELHIKKESVFSKAIKSVGERELISEELRLFYVALTRAKEKLIVVGTVKDYEEKEGKIQDKYSRYISSIPPAFVAQSNSLLDYVLISCPRTSPLYTVEVIDQQDLTIEEGMSVAVVDERKKMLKELLEREVDVEVNIDTETNEVIETMDLLFRDYHHVEATQKFSTMSVSELKDIEGIYFEPELSKSYSYEPLFLEQEDQKHHGVRFGTLMHKVLMHLPLEVEMNDEKIRVFLESLNKKGVLNQEEVALVDYQKIVVFTQSQIYDRMVRAAATNQLYREQPFVLGITEGDDLRMVQGVIDVFFIEDGQAVLVDYKTDVIRKNEADQLLNKYAIQLCYYRDAIEKIMNIPVKEAYIYSLFLGRGLLQK